MIQERHPVRYAESDDGSFGRIELSKLADPETVKVFLCSSRIYPKSFDIYGAPQFTKEQIELALFEEEELHRKEDEGKQVDYNVFTIEYEERKFHVSRSSFDSLKGIKEAMETYTTFEQMLINRKLFHKVHPNVKLREYVICDYLLLDSYGQVNVITEILQHSYKMLETFGQFKKRNSSGIITIDYRTKVIPPAQSCCPVCGEAITLNDILYQRVYYSDKQFFHWSCFSEYRYRLEIDKFTRRMMNFIYQRSDYQYEVISNGYDHNSSIPWFLFHTPDGDIIMGWRKRVISIEWQENYKAFDFNTLFAKEDVTKWYRGGKRGIHAWGESKAYDYLKMVREAVNPKYEA